MTRDTAVREALRDLIDKVHEFGTFKIDGDDDPLNAFDDMVVPALVAGRAALAADPQPSSAAEIACEDCGRHVMADPQPASGFIAACGKRLTRLDECVKPSPCPSAPTVDKPKRGSIWRHHSGREYRVLFIANDVPDPKPEYPVTVVYEGCANGMLWAGRLDDWHRRMTLIPWAGSIAQRSRQDAWAALGMIREAVETLGPIGAMPAEESLAGPTFLHEADAIVAGIMKMKEAAA